MTAAATIAATLAERIAAVRYDDLPPEAVHWAKVAILDTIGCTLAGSTEPCARIVDLVDDGRCIRRPVPDLRHQPPRPQRWTRR